MSPERTSAIERPPARTIAEVIRRAETTAPQYLGAEVNIKGINTLRQPRATFEEIPELAQDFAINGNLNPPTVARLTKKQAIQYIELVNRRWSINHSFKELVVTKENGSKIVYILLAGERRFRAFQHLMTVGCFNCVEEFGEGPCYKRHFPDRCNNGEQRIEVRLAVNTTPLRAAFLQMSENIHQRVPAVEDAKSVHNLLMVIRKEVPDYPLARFARDVGRSESHIRNAVRFCDLPESVQEHVSLGSLPFGMALEISRFQKEANADEEELLFWAVRAMVERRTVPEFQKLIDAHIETRTSGQQSFNDIFTSAQEREMRKLAIRKVVAKEVILSLWGSIAYVKKVNRLLLEGLLAKKDSPYSHKSPVKVIRSLVDILEEAIPNLIQIMPKKEIARTRKALDAADIVLPRLERYLKDDKNVAGLLGN